MSIFLHIHFQILPKSTMAKFERIWWGIERLLHVDTEVRETRHTHSLGRYYVIRSASQHHCCSSTTPSRTRAISRLYYRQEHCLYNMLLFAARKSDICGSGESVAAGHIQYWWDWLHKQTMNMSQLQVLSYHYSGEYTILYEAFDLKFSPYALERPQIYLQFDSRLKAISAWC